METTRNLSPNIGRLAAILRTPAGVEPADVLAAAHAATGVRGLRCEPFAGDLRTFYVYADCTERAAERVKFFIEGYNDGVTRTRSGDLQSIAAAALPEHLRGKAILFPMTFQEAHVTARALAQVNGPGSNADTGDKATAGYLGEKLIVAVRPE